MGRSMQRHARRSSMKDFTWRAPRCGGATALVPIYWHSNASERRGRIALRTCDVRSPAVAIGTYTSNVCSERPDGAPFDAYARDGHSDASSVHPDRGQAAGWDVHLRWQFDAVVGAACVVIHHEAHRSF